MGGVLGEPAVGELNRGVEVSNKYQCLAKRGSVLHVYMHSEYLQQLCSAKQVGRVEVEPALIDLHMNG
jgi:hypothetical protein